jgi:hypothetical protein
MRSLSQYGLGLMVITLLCIGEPLSAGNQCCSICHDEYPVTKKCRLVCEMEEVTETKWECKCEEFCVPGPSQKCGEQCQHDCDSAHGVTCKTIWKPSCAAEVRTRKILVKKEVKKQVPKYRWVVEHVCSHCEASSAHTAFHH